MHGNFNEWTYDWYSSTYPTGSITDPTGPATGTMRVLRGGSWLGGPKYSRSAERSVDSSNLRYNYLGLRLLRNLN